MKCSAMRLNPAYGYSLTVTKTSQGGLRRDVRLWESSTAWRAETHQRRLGTVGFAAQRRASMKCSAMRLNPAYGYSLTVTKTSQGGLRRDVRLWESSTAWRAETHQRRLRTVGFAAQRRASMKCSATRLNPPCTFHDVREPAWIDWSRADLPGATIAHLCREHFRRTCAPAGTAATDVQ